MGLKYHSIPSRAESDNPMDGACVLACPGCLILGIRKSLGSLLVMGIKFGISAVGCKGGLAAKAAEVDETKWWRRMSLE
jgi:hypothetical protein